MTQSLNVLSQSSLSTWIGRSSLSQHLSNRITLVEYCPCKRSRTAFVLYVDLRTASNQRFRGFHLPLIRGPSQRGIPLFISRIRIGTTVEQRLNNRYLTFLCSIHQGSPLTIPRRVRFHPRGEEMFYCSRI